MLTKTTISIDEDTLHTAKKTQVDKLRGGFSEYVELLILKDLSKKGQQIIPKFVEPNA